MSNSATIAKLLAEIKELDEGSMKYLLEQIRQLQMSRRSEPVMLSQLNGLGGEIWKGIDVNDYLQQERQWE